MPPRRTRSASREASTSRRRRREPTPSPPPSPLPWELPTPRYNAKYRILHKRLIVASKFFDPYTITQLGLRGDVNLFTHNIGWTRFANLNFPTYKSITLEFLSTLRSTYHPHVERDPPSIFFQCMGEERQLTMAQFNGIFEFPNAGISWNVPRFSPTQAWRQLTGQDEYNPSCSKSTLIRNHALRYIHRVMSLSIFGRGKSRGVVSKVELLMMWAMMNGEQINTGAWLLKHLLHVAAASSGSICVGGIISIIANAFGFVPVQDIHPMVEGSTLVDIDTLINMRIARHIGGGNFRLLDDEGQIIEPEEDEADDEAGAAAEEPPEDPVPPPEQADMGHFQAPNPEPQFEWQMEQMLQRMERLETRMNRSEDFQIQMMQMMQRNLDATERIEEKLSHLK